MELLGPENAVWDEGEWVSLSGIKSHLERRELEALYPGADVEHIPMFKDLLNGAAHYFRATGRHLPIYGELGELFGAIMFGIRLHRENAMGSDGRLGNDFVEIKTISPHNKHDRVLIRLDRHFSKLLIVRISDDFVVEGRLLTRKSLETRGRKRLQVSWLEAISISERHEAW